MLRCVLRSATLHRVTDAWWRCPFRETDRPVTWRAHLAGLTDGDGGCEVRHVVARFASELRLRGGV